MRTAEAIRHFGSAAKLARALGITRQSIHDWGKRVPQGRAFQIEVLTAGALKAPRQKTGQREARVGT